jgi:anti-anti-sigma factor
VLDESGMCASVGAIVDWDENRGVLQCTGDEDRSTQGRRRRALARAILAFDDVTVDLSDLGFADTSLMLDLAMLARRLRRTGRALLLRCPQPQIRRLIELVGLHRMDGVHVVAQSVA